MTYEYQTEFTYVADTDPLTGAPVMTAIPQTVRAAKQGIPYNVLSNFGDLFKRENLREAWRLLRKNDPFDYQIQVADAILYSCLNGLGWYFVVQITRQAGKNEISAFLQHYLLLYGWYFGIPVSGVKFAPVYKPQIQASMDRLEGAPTLDSGGLAGSVITSGQAKVDGQPCKYSKSDGYKFHIGPPRDSNKWAFLSIFDKTFIEDSYACRRGKGQKAAADRLQDMIKQTEVLGGKWYYLKLDIAKYFYRIYHDKLMEILERKIKDPDMLELLNVIVKGDGTNAFGLSICDNVEDAERLTDRGMPIGNLTSQLLANVYLNELDQFCKKVLGTKFYIRYMDDVIILSQSKEELHEIKERISKFLDEELQLTLNKKTCIRPVSMGIQFVGLHIWSTHRTVRKSTSLRIKRRLKAAAKQYVAGNLTYERYNSTLQSYMGMMKHNDCYHFKMQLLEDVETIINESGVAA